MVQVLCCRRGLDIQGYYCTQYIIYAGKPITVYCVFDNIFGYTFISKTANDNILNLEYLYDINSFALIRHLTTFGEQKQVKIEQLNSYSSQWNLHYLHMICRPD
jgi:hypothetical protein